MLHNTWINLSAKVGGRDIIDWWQFMYGSLRQQLRGWARNIGVTSKREKESLKMNGPKDTTLKTNSSKS
jgi:hypothetical protein